MIFPVEVLFEVDEHGRAYADFRRPSDALDGVDARVAVGARDEVDAWDGVNAHEKVDLRCSQNQWEK